MINIRNYFSIPVFVVLLLLSGKMSYASVSGLPDFTELVEKYSDAVVNISTTQKVTRKNNIQNFDIPGGPFGDLFRKFFEQQNYQPDARAEKNNNESLGSGFIIDSAGYVVTNNHVIAGADTIIVRLKDRRELKAEVIGSDERSDIALLKIEADNLPQVKIGKSDNLKVGAWVMAIGSPFGFDHSVSVGVISATGRTLPSENYVPFIQTDVAINPGNSGGPLFNLNGEVIGINSQIYSRTGGFMGLSFAIPIDVATDIIKQLKQKGHASWGWLGVLIQDVNKELAESFEMDEPMGAVVLRVLEDTPAEKAGLQVGDVITHFNGQKIIRSSDLPLAVGKASIGSKVKVKIIREGKSMSLKVQIAELPEEEALAKNGDTNKQSKSNKFKVEVSKLTKEQKSRAKIQHGILVQQVNDGPAQKAGIQRGDIILKINGIDIKTISQFTKVVDELDEDKWVRVLIQRGDSPRFIPLKISEE